uniref:Uncharacterized protein n=1 Tax=Neobodo designis TaxID=312471 RepID=A0A7S1PL45_NEODS|mmetsp:Transcript_11127/g.34555  ORF Transcript_11127/g.34555 Transcript_11127/m.34555 type:complete len:316 (+) Transcript_11127:59-1006(+)
MASFGNSLGHSMDGGTSPLQSLFALNDCTAVPPTIDISASTVARPDEVQDCSAAVVPTPQSRADALIVDVSVTAFLASADASATAGDAAASATSSVGMYAVVACQGAMGERISRELICANFPAVLAASAASFAGSRSPSASPNASAEMVHHRSDAQRLRVDRGTAAELRVDVYADATRRAGTAAGDTLVGMARLPLAAVAASNEPTACTLPLVRVAAGYGSDAEPPKLQLVVSAVSERAATQYHNVSLSELLNADVSTGDRWDPILDGALGASGTSFGQPRMPSVQIRAPEASPETGALFTTSMDPPAELVSLAV